MIEKHYKDTLYLQIDGFNNDKIKHIFSSRIGWDQDNIFHRLEEIFNVDPDYIYRPKQVHGTDILIIDGQDNLDVDEMEFDGLITNIPNIVLSTYHADCVPLYFNDPIKGLVGVAHSGWKGSLNNIAGKMVHTMIKSFGSRIEDIRVGVGPSICKYCYEVQDDVSKLFIDKLGQDVIMYKNGKQYLDLWIANRINLMNEGILEKNLFMSNYCTSCNKDKLFSYRKENNTKNRMITGIMLLE